MTTTFASSYHGADTCDFRPAWGFTDAQAVALADGAFDADPDDLLPWLILADRLEDIGDPASVTVRWACGLWQGSRTLRPRKSTNWDKQECEKALAIAEESLASWRKVCLWGCLLAWHAPSGIEDVPLGRTWADARVMATNRGVWCWCLGLCDDAAWSQAYAAWSQADAAGRQADAAGRQADAAGRQAYAAGSQADAAWRQAYAAGSQAYAAGSQAGAAGSQAGAAGSQAVWAYAKTLWQVIQRSEP